MISFTFASTDEDKLILEQVYIKTNKVLYGYAYRILKDHGLAEDAIHEAFIRLGNNLDKIDAPDSKKTLNYMITIVENVSKTMYGKYIKAAPFTLEDYDEDINQSTESVGEFVVRQEEYNLLREAISQLDDKFRKPLILQYVYGMKENEIAKELGLTQSNVGVRLFRAKCKIKEYIERKEAGSR